MKILIIHPFFTAEGARGSEIIAQDTYKILKKNNHEVFYFATNKKPYIEKTEWTKYFPTFNKHFAPQNYWNFEAKCNLEKMLEYVKPDIVHVHVTGQLTYSILQPILHKKIPVVMTVHDVGIVCPARYAWDKKNKIYCNKCKNLNVLPCIIQNCILSKKRISSFNVALTNFLEKVSGYNKKINKFITPSQALANYITSKDIPLQKIEIIPNFINNEFMQKISNCNNEQNYFLYVGTLADYKGVDTLLNAIKNLPKEIPFKIVGSGFQEDKYKQFVQDNHLSNVEFLGNLNREDIIKYYKNCISTVVPSACFDNFPTAILECFIFAKPTIGSNLGGIQEQIDNNINGLLFDSGNAEQLMECILTYWNNKSLAIQHGENAYKKAIKLYMADVYYKKVVKVYEEVLNVQK